jgi:hypothetical protein
MLYVLGKVERSWEYPAKGNRSARIFKNNFPVVFRDDFPAGASTVALLYQEAHLGLREGGRI